MLPLFNDFFEQELTTKLGREKGSPRLNAEQPRLIDWKCASCGCQDAIDVQVCFWNQATAF